LQVTLYDPYLSASEVVFHEEALYQVYLPLPFTFTRVSPFWILLVLRMMEVLATTVAVRHAKFQSKCHHQQTSTQFFTGQMPLLSPNHQCQSTEGKRGTTSQGDLCRTWHDPWKYRLVSQKTSLL